MSTTALHDSPLVRAWQRMRTLLLARPWMGTETLIVGACLYFSLFANGVFWRAAAPQPLTQWQWALSLFLLVTAANGVWLTLLVWRRTARVVLSLLVVTSALAGHYMAAYGIYIDADMVRNVLHTDWREASELAGVDALVPLLATLPALAVIWRVRLRERTWKRTLALRVALLAGMVGTAVLGVLPVTQPLTAFLRNQREVRYLVTPANVLVSLAKVVSEEPPGRARACPPPAVPSTRPCSRTGCRATAWPRPRAAGRAAPTGGRGWPSRRTARARTAKTCTAARPPCCCRRR